jgi:hypothetical protein
MENINERFIIKELWRDLFIAFIAFIFSLSLYVVMFDHFNPYTPIPEIKHEKYEFINSYEYNKTIYVVKCNTKTDQCQVVKKIKDNSNLFKIAIFDLIIGIITIFFTFSTLGLLITSYQLIKIYIKNFLKNNICKKLNNEE